MDMLRRIDVVPALIPETHVFETFEDGIAWVNTHLINGSAQQTQDQRDAVEPSTVT
jgi:hypothetical protein